MSDDIQAVPATDAGLDDTAATQGGKSEIAGQLKDALAGKEAAPTESSSRAKLRADIEGALTKATEPEAKTPVTDAQGRVRGADGKFVAKEAMAPETPQPAAPAEATPAPVQTVAEKPPAGWSKDNQAQFATLPDWARAEIAKREADVEKGFAKYQNLRSVEPILDFAAQIAPRLGVPAPKLIEQWAIVQRALLTPQQAPAAIQWLAKQYNVALPAAAPAAAPSPPNGAQPEGQTDSNAFVDPELAALKKTIQELTGWKSNFERQIEQSAVAQQQAYQREKLSALDKFEAEKGPDGQPLRPHLGTVMPTMVGRIAQLKQANPQLSDQDVLQQAYDMEVRANPETFKAWDEARKIAEETERKAQARTRAQAATRAAVSPAGSSPQGPPAQPSRKLPIREQLREAYEQHTT